MYTQPVAHSCNASVLITSGSDHLTCGTHGQDLCLLCAQQRSSTPSVSLHPGHVGSGCSKSSRWHAGASHIRVWCSSGACCEHIHRRLSIGAWPSIRWHCRNCMTWRSTLPTVTAQLCKRLFKTLPSDSAWKPSSVQPPTMIMHTVVTHNSPDVRCCCRYNAVYAVCHDIGSTVYHLTLTDHLLRSPNSGSRTAAKIGTAHAL